MVKQLSIISIPSTLWITRVRRVVYMMDIVLNTAPKSHFKTTQTWWITPKINLVSTMIRLTKEEVTNTTSCRLVWETHNRIKPCSICQVLLETKTILIMKEMVKVQRARVMGTWEARIIQLDWWRRIHRSRKRFRWVLSANSPAQLKVIWGRKEVRLDLWPRRIQRAA